MSDNSTANWCGDDFYVYEPEGDWKDLPGVYIFVRLQGKIWYPLYVGETGSFKTRPLSPNHEKWDEAVQRGMNQIHARVVSGRGTADELTRRQDIEGAIYDAYYGHDLPLNDEPPPRSKVARGLLPRRPRR